MPVAGGYPPLPPYERRSNPRAGILAGVIVACCVLVVIALLVAIAMPNISRVGNKAKEAEVKQNVHAIQIALERYNVDRGGYPEYLIGGSAEWAANAQASASNPLGGLQQCSGPVSDPLLREGYFDRYPRNPFVRGVDGSLAVYRVQEAVTEPSSGDPLRDGPGGLGDKLGTRFGPRCFSMGQVLCDPRYPLRVAEGGGAPVETGATVEYRYWDIWAGAKPAPFLPGEFFYKSWSGVLYPERPDFRAKPADSVPPAQLYHLGAYGGPRSKGMDVLGDEVPLPQAPAGSKAKRSKAPDMRWIWLRSLNDPAQYGGCPYEIGTDINNLREWDHYPANGVTDAVVICLYSGVDIYTWEMKHPGTPLSGK